MGVFFEEDFAGFAVDGDCAAGFDDRRNLFWVFDWAFAVFENRENVLAGGEDLRILVSRNGDLVKLGVAV